MRGGSGEGKYYGYQSSRKMYSDALLSPALIIFLMDFHDWCLSKLGYQNLSPHISMLKKSLFISSLHSGWKYWENVQKGANKILLILHRAHCWSMPICLWPCGDNFQNGKCYHGAKNIHTHIDPVMTSDVIAKSGNLSRIWPNVFQPIWPEFRGRFAFGPENRAFPVFRGASTK